MGTALGAHQAEGLHNGRVTAERFLRGMSSGEVRMMKLWLLRHELPEILWPLEEHREAWLQADVDPLMNNV